MDLLVATCRPLPEPDPDEQLLLDALDARGVRARMAAWHDAGAWTSSVPTVVRSTWDYIHRLDDFLSWVRRVSLAAPLWNPAAIVRWNAHKFYLRELERRGMPIVPTEFVERGSTRALAEILRERGWDDAVIKPAVSAGSFRTLRARGADLEAGERHLRELAAQGDVLVQRYARAVEGTGERALVWIDGELTHAVRKTPRFTGEEERVSTALPIAADERELALATLAPFADGLLYARVDLVRADDGTPALMELELIEPSLFLLQSPRALARLADGIARRLSASRRASSG